MSTGAKWVAFLLGWIVLTFIAALIDVSLQRQGIQISGAIPKTLLYFVPTAILGHYLGIWRKSDRITDSERSERVRRATPYTVALSVLFDKGFLSEADVAKFSRRMANKLTNRELSELKSIAASDPLQCLSQLKNLKILSDYEHGALISRTPRPDQSTEAAPSLADTLVEHEETQSKEK